MDHNYYVIKQRIQPGDAFVNAMNIFLQLNFRTSSLIHSGILNIDPLSSNDTLVFGQDKTDLQSSLDSRQCLKLNDVPASV